MKLYLMSDEIMLRGRWISALSDLKPVTFSEMTLDIDADGIILISDTLLFNKQDETLKKLFKYRVMVFSMDPNFLEAQNFLQMGAMGYGNAMMHESHLHSAYQALEEGKVWLHPDFITLMITQIRDQNNSKEKSLLTLNILSSREREVALLLGKGASHQEISDNLDITVRTVKAHATSIYQKLNIKDRLALSLLLHT
ncbi:MAG: LuxR C-terminal-related transcriptional regulator [Sulfuricurvum sp.]|nr:LuxR C-terminal-related transcriptional regulator [Sulfuricurvum sp.]MDD5053727.1 LuxR C-terminal-related transcriptional regulator [Sulfuricurvum sp.]